MKQFYKNILLGLAIAGAGALAMSAPIHASVLGDACDQNPNSAVCKQAAGNPDTAVNNLVQDIIGLLLFAIGIVSVIMIIIGGFRYVTSNGDSGQITSAKNTILYAVIGLVLSLMAWGIVTFVLNAFR